MPSLELEKINELYWLLNDSDAAHNSSLGVLDDLSGKGRTGTASSSGAGRPKMVHNAVNGKKAVRWDVGQNPIQTADTSFSVRCGWIVVNHATEDVFLDFEGVLSSLGLVYEETSIVAAEQATSYFDFPTYADNLFEFRRNDLIYPTSSMRATLGGWSILFFRYWIPATFRGVQIGQDREFTDRRLNGDIALVALSSLDFCESEIRTQTETIAAFFGLSANLADVFPYPASWGRTIEMNRAAIVFQGRAVSNRIVKTLSDQSEFQMIVEAAARTKAETRAARAFWEDRYPGSEFVFRDQAVVPPEDYRSYFVAGSGFSESAARVNLHNYNFEIIARPSVCPPSRLVDSDGAFIIDDDGDPVFDVEGDC